MSSDGHFLAAVTDNNLVCIWRYAPPVTTANTNVLSATTTSAVTTVSESTATAAPEMTTTEELPVVTDDAGNCVDPILMNIPVTVRPEEKQDTFIETEQTNTEHLKTQEQHKESP